MVAVTSNPTGSSGAVAASLLPAIPNWRQRREMRRAARKQRIAERSAKRAARAARQQSATVFSGSTTTAPLDPVGALPGISAAGPQPFVDRFNNPLPIGGIYNGASVFIILAGPSINRLDLSLLSRRGCITMGVNNSPAVVRTQLWTHVDPVRKFHDAIWRDPGCTKIVVNRMLKRAIRTRAPDGNLAEMMVRRADGRDSPATPQDMPNVIGYRRTPAFDPPTFLSEQTVNWGVSGKWSKKMKRPKCLNVMLAVLKIAYSLGFRTVYLVGCDFKMEAEQAYAFNQDKDAGQAASNNNAYRLMSGMLAELLPHFNAAGFRVFNCNPDSHLTVFPHLSYEQAIEAASGGIEQKPDCRDWYTK